MLVDADLTSWQAWNDFATEFAEATGARLVHIDDGGIAGPAFHDRALRLNAPVLMSPKRYFDRLPASLRTVRSSTHLRSGAGRSSLAQTMSAIASPLYASTPATRSNQRPPVPLRPGRTGFPRPTRTETTSARSNDLSVAPQTVPQAISSGPGPPGESIVHDGDQNKAGGDVGQGCVIVTVP